MTKGLIGRKLGMTRVFTENGDAVPVTVIEAGPCQRAAGAHRRGAARLRRAEAATRASKAELGHAKAAGLDGCPGDASASSRSAAMPRRAGVEVKVDIFAAGELVKVTGTTKGRGFQGVVHRHGFRGGPATHGNTRHRKPGSISPGTDPSRVIKGKKMPGHHGAANGTRSWA